MFSASVDSGGGEEADAADMARDDDCGLRDKRGRGGGRRKRGCFSI